MSEALYSRTHVAQPDMCAVVVTYHPDHDFEHNLRAMVAECGRVIVVDNGSGGNLRARVQRVSGVEWMELGQNMGVAAALNRGAHRALELGCRWMVSFDQDSCPQPGFARALTETWARVPHPAVIGARIEDAALTRSYLWLRRHPRHSWWFQRVPCENADLDDVTMVVTSGALTDLECWRKIGGFDEALFVDFVDTDYCLRCKAAGRFIAVSAGARLRHRLGRREARKIAGVTFHPTHHSPLRHYYVARNRVPMIRRHGRERHWLLFELVAAGLWLFRVIVFENRRWAKLKAMVLGTWDGWHARLGPCSPARVRVFEA